MQPSQSVVLCCPPCVVVMCCVPQAVTVKCYENNPLVRKVCMYSGLFRIPCACRLHERTCTRAI